MHFEIFCKHTQWYSYIRIGFNGCVIFGRTASGQAWDMGRGTGRRGHGRTGWHTNWVALAEAWALASSRAQHKHGWLKWAKCQTIKKTPLPTATSTAAPLCSYLLCVTRSCWFLLSWPSQSCNLNHEGRGSCGRKEAEGRSRDSARVNPCEELLLVRCPLVLIMLRKHKNWVPIRNNKRWPAWPAHPEAAGNGDWHGGGGRAVGRLKGTNLCNFFVVCLCVCCAVLYSLAAELKGYIYGIGDARDQV